MSRTVRFKDVRIIASEKCLAAILWEGEDLRRTKLDEIERKDEDPILLIYESSGFMRPGERLWRISNITISTALLRANQFSELLRVTNVNARKSTRYQLALPLLDDLRHQAEGSLSF